MDINDFYTADEHEKGREVAINNPSTGEPSDVVFIVRGPDSKTFRKAILKSNRANLEVDDTDRMTDLLVAVTIDWRGLKQGSGKDAKYVPFSPEAARKIYDQSPDVATQVMTFVSQRQNFIKG